MAVDLGIAGKIALWTIALGTFVAIVISVFMYRASVDALVQREQATLGHSVDAATTRLVARMEITRRDAVFMSRLPSVIALARPADATGDRNTPRDQLAQVFTAMLLARPDYNAIRYIGIADGGGEIVRVDRSDGGSIQRAPDRALQATDETPYFRGTAALPVGAVYVSPADLNREFGIIETPLRPVIRIATPVYDPPSGRVAGMIVVNANATYLFDLIAQVLGRETEFALANQDGDYLIGPNPMRNYGFDLGQRYFIQDDLPEMARFFDGQSGAFAGFVDWRGEEVMAAVRRIVYNPREPGRYMVLAAFVPAAEALRNISSERGRVALLAIVVIAIAAVFAVVLARRIVGPLREMTGAASRIAKGEHDLDIHALTLRIDETGALARAFEAMMREIGERESRLMVQAAELTRSNQDLAQFAYLASHDLQEPLRMVASYLELLERRFADSLDDEAREFIGYAVDGATRMKRLINDLLDYSRAGNASLRTAEVDTGELVGTVLRTLSIPIGEVHGQVTVEPMPAIAADGEQLGRVFQNLVENALKYRSRAAPRIRIAAEALDGFWKFSVRDNGIGVDPRFADKVFEIFKRLHGRDKYPGTGIGLAICKLIVDRHGGRIWVEPRPNGGSVFSFTIPR
ncbi:MAG: ATP-binding protein [Bauldia sp.]